LNRLKLILIIMTCQYLRRVCWKRNIKKEEEEIKDKLAAPNKKRLNFNCVETLNW